MLAVGNFALTVALLEISAEIATKHIPQWKIIDDANDGRFGDPQGQFVCWSAPRPWQRP
jgi:hypothetical protein